MPEPESAPDRTRRPHAVLDGESRVLKARKIARLTDAHLVESGTILEVGCGSGAIAHALANLNPVPGRVSAIDVVDNRIIKDGYDFKLVNSTKLPFPDKHFDLIITNHVIEHVGDEHAQLDHLAEIRRVLKDDGLVYLAVPNRWRLVEPHYRLPLLSWFPQTIADIYVRTMGAGNHYDCKPLGPMTARRLFKQSRFLSRDVTLEALRATLAIEHADRAWTRLINRHVPGWAIRPGMPLVPTFVFLLTKS